MNILFPGRPAGDEMNEEHTPEPWHVSGEFHIGAKAGGPMVIASANDAHTHRDANARRIVACVNACAGIKTETLEGSPNSRGGAFELSLISMTRQRDELAEALRNADCNCTMRERDSGHRVGCWKPDADAALAKVSA